MARSPQDHDARAGEVNHFTAGLNGWSSSECDTAPATRPESRQLRRPSAEELSAIAGTLGVTVDYLIGSDEQTLDEAEDTAFFRSTAACRRRRAWQIREMAGILDTKTRR
jgi:hypothetical protein